MMRSFLGKMRPISKLVAIFLIGLVFAYTSSFAQAVSPKDLQDILRKTEFFSDEDICTDPGGIGGGGGSDVDRFMQVLALQESTNNPTAQNPDSSASGKYQYIDSTWKGHAQEYYPPALQWARAYMAPEPVQDALVYIEYTKKFKDYDSDLFKLAVSHMSPAAAADPSKLDTTIGKNKITPRQYANSILERIERGEGMDVPLRYTEAPDFQTYLTQNGGESPPTVATSATTTPAPVATCGAGPAGDFVFYSQYDNRWRNHPYGTSTIAEAGCGPSSLAMIVATFVDKAVTPKEVADYGTQNNFFVEGQGSSWDLFTKGPLNWGLSSQDIEKNMDSAIEIIRAGGLVIASGTGAEPFTDKGHIIVLRGVTESGKILIGDPGHPNLNQTEFDVTELLPYIRNMWGITK